MASAIGSSRSSGARQCRCRRQCSDELRISRFCWAALCVLATGLTYFDTGINGVTDAGSVRGAAAFGDMSKGEHSTWIRMSAGFKGAVHTHTYDFWVAVVSGVAVNTDVGGKDIILAPGSFWFQTALHQLCFIGRMCLLRQPEWRLRL